MDTNEAFKLIACKALEEGSHVPYICQSMGDVYSLALEKKLFLQVIGRMLRVIVPFDELNATMDAKENVKYVRGDARVLAHYAALCNPTTT